MLSAKDSQGKSMLVFGLHGLHLLGRRFFLSGGMSDLRTFQVSATISGSVVRARPRSTKPGSRWPMAQLAKAGLLNSKYDHLPSSPCVSNWYSEPNLTGGEQCSWRSWQTSTCEDLRVYADFSSEWGVNIKWYQVSTWSYMIHGSDWARCLFMLKWISHDITQCDYLANMSCAAKMLKK